MNYEMHVHVYVRWVSTNFWGLIDIYFDHYVPNVKVQSLEFEGGQYDFQESVVNTDGGYRDISEGHHGP